MTQTKYIPKSGLIEVEEGTGYNKPGTIVNYYSLFGASGKNAANLQQTVNGPTNGISSGVNIVIGLSFYVSTGNNWLYGYWIWSQPGTNPLPAGPLKCCCWQVNSSSINSVLPGSTAFVTTKPGWNLVMLPAPLPLTPNTMYLEAIGVNGNFNDTNSYFGSGDIGNGLHNGPLYAVSAANKGWSTTTTNGMFSTAGSDPTTTIPIAGDGSGDGMSNFWLDVLIGNTPQPAGYTGTYHIWPNWPNPLGVEVDTAAVYNVATEFSVSRIVTLKKIIFYSVTGCTGLPTETAIWTVPGGTTPGIIVPGTDKQAISWQLFPGGGAGSAGAGWLYADYSASPVTFGPGTFKVSVYDGAATPTQSTTKLLNYWQEGATPPLGPGAGGWTNGPITVPDTAHANQAWEFNGSNPGTTPPYSNGIQEPGQSIFSQNTANASPISYPFLYVDALWQNYLVDIEVT